MESRIFLNWNLRVGGFFTYLGVVSLIVLVRGWMHFTTPLVKGVNGAYYLVQTRALIERGSLAIADFPLTFELHAALAKIIQWLTGGSLEASVLFAVKLADTLLPALVAIPVIALLESWRRLTDAPRWLPAAGAVVACAGLPMMRALGDFQKNGLGLVWLAALLWCLHAWIAQKTKTRAMGVLVCFGLIGVTHLGVLGAAILIGALVGGLLFLSERDRNWRQLVPWIGSVAAVLVLAVLVAWRFDPERVDKLLGALGNPLSYVQGEREPLPGMSAQQDSAFRMLALFLLFGCMAMPALVSVWRRRSMLPASTLAVVAACGLAVLAMVGPWVASGDRLFRFMILAYLPATLSLFFALQFMKRARWRVAFVSLASVFWIGLMPGTMATFGRAAIPDAAGGELRSLSALIGEPKKTLIVTGHGLEWWAAWMLETRISQGTVMSVDDWQKYTQVLFLIQKTDLLPMAAQAVKEGGGTPDSVGQGEDAISGSYFASPPIPPDAEILHDGKYFTLARVAAPPSYLRKTLVIAEIERATSS